ncbi:ubiquitin carboxyl-terminal hydrolase 22 [Lepeophtheirus salmonis]|uniref:Ubiquitin carboxyl-terminal hydrolase n=1 Tax=Lepeophtheirus salmonis TaxID=72036 RepID=A0A0K2TC62_LEPSM|nr:ubiquitin carboxyl-terminal hydrolase 22-like [Lepeophtheirus salmonis]
MSCSHFTEYKNLYGTGSYRVVHLYFVSPTGAEAREWKSKSCLCHSCQTHGPQLKACLHCIHFGCPDHYASHARKLSHNFSVELQYGYIYCFNCGDYIYDSDCEMISQICWTKSYHAIGLGTPFSSWSPSNEDIVTLQKNKKRKGFANNTTIGLRGLINLGNTCFMSCIIQSLIHTPLLRDYFLSDRHRCMFQGKNDCMVCEVARLFQEFYSGSKVPLVPHVLLHMTWTHAHHLAGYEQQDAHEFFIATLDLLHRHLIHKTTVNPSNCDCIVDKIFTGKLQSDVVCQNCKGVSTTIDPFWDISLDLPAVVPSSSSQGISLHNCLERFTKPEHLGSSAKIKCSNCQTYQESTKQLTMKKLPIVASFHLKRFEHSSRFHKKISTRIAFPEILDMSPFVSHIRNNSSSFSPVNSGSYTYTLFAVINHTGNIEAGHYTSFVRQHRDRWYRCNDHQIVPADLSDVLGSEGYLLFYHKQILEYN